MRLIGDVPNAKKRNELGRISEDTTQSLLLVRLQSRAFPPFRPPELMPLDAAAVCFKRPSQSSANMVWVGGHPIEALGMIHKWTALTKQIDQIGRKAKVPLGLHVIKFSF
jgi:hypothetical protein